jgi:hypothetical protein
MEIPDMNIFVLDESPILSAQWQHDRHVVKMILESAQMLSTCAHDGKFVGLNDDTLLYKRTHANHPCNIWLRDSMANVAWLTCHLDALVAEYHYRFRKVHATDGLRWLFKRTLAAYVGADRVHTSRSMSDGGLHPAMLELASQHTPFAVCMPDDYKALDAVESYRNVYIRSKIFQDHVKWTGRFIPDFILAASRWPVNHPMRTVIDMRIDALQSRSQSQLTCPIADRTFKAPRQPRIDSMVAVGPKNPKALTRFGSR